MTLRLLRCHEFWNRSIPRCGWCATWANMLRADGRTEAGSEVCGGQVGLALGNPDLDEGGAGARAGFDLPGAGNSGAGFGLGAIGGGGSAHVSFHVGQAGAARAIGDMAAAGAGGQVVHMDGAELGELLGAIPDVAEALLAHVAAGHGELHAGIHVAGRGDVGQRVAGAATVALEHVVVDGRRWGRKTRRRCR